MEERPIIFSGEMVKAIKEGRKTQTRRVIKPQPIEIIHAGRYKIGRPKEDYEWRKKTVKLKDILEKCPYGRIGDRLWIKETYWIDEDDPQEPYYKASEEDPDIFPKWKPSIFMPRWASRITLEITNVRVERLQDISEEDAEKEGLKPSQEAQSNWSSDCKRQFHNLWNSINGKKYPWVSNIWVWVIEFRRIKG